MGFSPLRGDRTRSHGDRDTAPGVLLLLFGLVAALAPRGLPVWIIAAGAAAVWARPAMPGLRTIRWWSATGLTLALLVTAAAGALWSPSPRAALTALELAYVALGILMVGAWIGHLPAERCGRAADWMAAGLIAGAAVFILEAALDFPLNRWWNGLPDSAPIDLGNVPKRTAAVLALLVWPAALALWRRRGAAGVILPPAYAAVTLFLSSRSALAGMAFGLLAFAAARRWPNAVRRTLATLLVAGFAGAVPAALVASDILHLDRAEGLFTSARHRVEIWGHAAARVIEAPVLGHGIDSSRALSPRDETSRFGPLTDSLLPLHPHNAFLQIWLELGAVGALLGAALTLIALRAIARVAPVAQPYALAMYACGLVMANTAYGLWQAWWMAGFAGAGLALALAARAVGTTR